VTPQRPITDDARGSDQPADQALDPPGLTGARHSRIRREPHAAAGAAPAVRLLDDRQFSTTDAISL